MEIDEIIEDILLSLLIYNVNNKNKWMWIDLLKLKINCDKEILNKAIDVLKENKFVEIRNNNYIKITKDGIDYIIEKI